MRLPPSGVNASKGQPHRFTAGVGPKAVTDKVDREIYNASLRRLQLKLIKTQGAWNRRGHEALAIASVTKSWTMDNAAVAPAAGVHVQGRLIKGLQ